MIPAPCTYPTISTWHADCYHAYPLPWHGASHPWRGAAFGQPAGLAGAGASPAHAEFGTKGHPTHPPYLFNKESLSPQEGA
jgi:hypothetical protein